MRRKGTFAAGLVSLSLLGCDRLHDVKVCRELAGRVNSTFDAVEQELAKGRTPAAYTKISARYRDLARFLEDFEDGSAELEKGVNELATLLRSTARQTTALASALEAKNAASETLATRELEHLGKQQRTLAQRIDDECRPK